jgi:hypothetical protein
VDRATRRLPLTPTQSILYTLSFVANPALIVGNAVNRIGMAFSIFVVFSAASASAADFPARKPGLWKVTITGADSFAVRQCSDAASDQTIFQAGIGASGNCTTRDVQESGNTITIDSVCRAAGKPMASHIVITGSLESKYTMTMSGQASGKSMTLHAEWLGPCGANQKPGDVIMPNGTKINLLSAERQASSGR